MDDKEDKPLVSQIIITFQDVNSVNMNLNIQNVTPLQAIAAAWYLKKHAEAGFFQQEMVKQQQQPKIEVPGLQMRRPKFKPQ